MNTPSHSTRVELRRRRPPDVRSPRIALVIPPGATIAYPPLGPPSLKGHAEQRGASVDVHDVNIHAFDELCSPSGITALVQRVVRHRSDLETRAQAQGNSDVLHFIDHVCSLSDEAFAGLTELPRRLRSREDFAHETRYSTTLHHFGVFEQLVEMAYHPVQFLPGSLIGGMFARVRDLEQLLTIETPYDRSVTRRLASTRWSSYDIVGFSAFSFDQLVFALRMVSDIRTAAPGALVALGGNILAESTLPPALERVLTSSFDVVVVGDGEEPLMQLCDVVAGTRRVDEVANAMWRNDEGEVEHAAHQYRFTFDDQSLPNFDGIPLERYPVPARVMPFRVSNGCDWARCSFCSEAADRGPVLGRDNYTEGPEDAIVAHLRELTERWGAEVLWNCSSQITAAGCASLADAIAATDLDIRWAGMVRAESGWTADRIARAAAGGVGALNFGVETFVPRINRLMRKGVHVGNAPDQLRTFRSHDIAVTLYTLMNYPSETLTEYLEHLEVVERHADMFDHLFKSIFMLVADAPAAAELQELGIEPPAELLAQLESSEFPYYMIPNGRTTGHYSSGYAYRWPDDDLERKDDAYHEMLLRLIEREPWYFDRHLEIVSRRKWWQPEYLMIDDLDGGSRQLPGFALDDFLDAAFELTAGTRLERLEDGLAALTRAGTPTAFYLGGLEAHFVEQVVGGADPRATWKAIDASGASAAQLVDLYHTVHGRLRGCELLTITVGSSGRARRGQRSTVAVGAAS